MGVTPRHIACLLDHFQNNKMIKIILKLVWPLRDSEGLFSFEFLKQVFPADEFTLFVGIRILPK